MENGFDDIWEYARDKGRDEGKREGISIGEERGISIGENNGILKCILNMINLKKLKGHYAKMKII